ncbi:MAG: M48 family metallopeptidase [Theionarchaea archaeon]|nr:M48 family metallopeptidase [Theionarchaea archaeon]
MYEEYSDTSRSIVFGGCWKIEGIKTPVDRGKCQRFKESAERVKRSFWKKWEGRIYRVITPEEFKQDVMMWAERLGVEPEGIHLRKMKSKWGKCSSKKLVFDISVLEEPYDVRLKVILHELLHLRYPNHGKMFSALLNSYFEEGIKEYE